MITIEEKKGKLVTTLRLAVDNTGGVDLIAETEDGTEKYLLKVTEGGIMLYLDADGVGIATEGEDDTVVVTRED